MLVCMCAGLLEADMLAVVWILEATCILESTESTVEKKLNGSPKELQGTPWNFKEVVGTPSNFMELQRTHGGKGTSRN